jgi:type IV secretory pathway VirB4 component
MTAMTGSALECLFPFSTSSMIEENGTLYGYHGLNDSPIVVDRFNRENGYNQLVVGNIGAGESFAVKLLLLRRLARDRDISGVIVDPRGGFRELIEAFGLDAEAVTVGGDRGINPLQIEPTPAGVLENHPDMDPLGERIESVLAFFEALHAESDAGSGLDAGDRAVLDRAISQTYNDAGITKDPATHSRDSPLPEDVDRILGEYASDPATALGEDASDREREKWADRAAELRMAMQPFRDGGRYDHLNQPTNIGLGEGGSRIVLLDTNQSEDSDAMPLTLKLLFDAIYERAKGPGRMIAAFDEVHKLLQTPGGLDWLSRAVRYSRHFLLSLVLISQTADEFFEDEDGNPNPKAKVIADNCPVKWLFRTTGLTDEHGEKLGLSDREIRFVRQATPGDRKRG